MASLHLGLATEVGKLRPEERRQVMEWLLADVAGRLPVAITVFGETPAAQIEFVRAAAELGAAWVILQPPPTRPLAEIDLLRFFGAVADASPVPVAIQNAPQYLGVGLTADGLLALRRHHENFVLLKGEGLGARDRAHDRGDSTARCRCSTAAVASSCPTCCAPVVPA